MNAVGVELLTCGALTFSGILLGDNVQPVSKKRYAPAIRCGFEQISRTLRLVHLELEQVPLLLFLNISGCAFGDELASHHEAKPVALFSFLQIVRGDQHGCAEIGEVIDHGPERAARQRIDAGGRLIKE